MVSSFKKKSFSLYASQHISQEIILSCQQFQRAPLARAFSFFYYCAVHMAAIYTVICLQPPLHQYYSSPASSHEYFAHEPSLPKIAK